MGQVKAYGSRSRNGCTTCKRRRVKCDETRPTCVRCSKLRLSCTFQALALTWEDEADQRGITFGRSLEARNKNRNRHSPREFGQKKIPRSNAVNHKNVVMRRSNYLYVNVTSRELEILSGGLQISSGFAFDSSFIGTIFEQTLIPTLKTHNMSQVTFDAFDFMILDNSMPLSFEDIFLDSFAAFPINQVLNVSEPSIDQCSFPLSQLESELLTYFIDNIGPYSVCCEVKPNSSMDNYIAPELNPYLHLIIPLALRSPLVMKTVVAASAAQLVLLEKSEYIQIAQTYLLEVISEITKLIETKNDSDGWDDVFAIVIMLCFIEISVNCSNSWLALLNYAKSVLKGSSSAREKILSPMGKFFVRYFISHEVMGETAWIHDTHTMVGPITIEDDPFIEDLKKDYDTKIDLVFGCSPYLISLIHRITVIGQCVDDVVLEDSTAVLKEYSKEVIKHAHETEEMLNCLNQQLPTNSEIYFSTEGQANISTIAEIKRLSALLYLYAVVFLNKRVVMEATTSTDLDPFRCTEIIMGLRRTLPDCYMSLLWPLFVIGLVTADTEDVRWFVLDNLRQMEQGRKLKTVQGAREIILNVWKEKDLGSQPALWKDIIKGKAMSISLA